MSKSKIGIMFVLVLLATSITFAQSFFSSAPTPDVKPGATTPQPLSADEFKSLSQQQNQKTQAQLNQQVTKTMAQQPFPMPAAPLGAPRPQSPTNNTANPVVPPAPTDTNVSNNVVPPAPTNSGDETQTQATQPDQPYTGYQTNTNAPANNRGGSSSSPQGLGIKY